MNPPMDPIIQRMQDVFERQRLAFLQHPYPTLAERKQKLKTLRALLQRYQDQIVAAVSADFGGRAPAETKLAEVLGPVFEINHALHALGGWMKPKKRSTELLFLGNSVRVNYQPKGVVGVIGAWNFPLYLSVGPLVAALAAGNRVMIKMSELSPRSTELLAQMLAEGFAEDEVAVFGGEVAQAQAFSHLPFNHIVFTGSPAVGHHIMRAASQNLTPVTLELGGKSPALVSAEGPLAAAAERIAHGKAFNSGQICVSPDYALVPRSKVEEFATEVQASFRKFYPTVQGNHEYTSITSEPHAQRIRDLLAEATAKGAKVTACGDSGPGRRIPLHVVTGVTADMRIAKEELFGPILPVIPYDNIDQAIAYIAARPRPLAMYPFGFSGAELDKLMRKTHSGGVSVDDWGWHVFNHDLPFGGVGNSGMGTYHGEEGFRELSHAKGTFKRFRWFPMGLFYPPYGNLVQRLVFKFYLGKSDPSVTVATGAAAVSPIMSSTPHQDVAEPSGRRSFLKVGALTVAAIGLGGWFASYLADRNARAVLGAGATLGAQAQTMLAKLADAVLDGALPSDASQRAQAIAKVVDTADKAVAGLPLYLQKEVQELFSMLGAAPTRALLIGQWSGWADATREDVASMLTGLRQSSVALRRVVYMSLRDMVTGSYYADTGTWEQIGYPGPMINGPGPEV